MHCFASLKVTTFNCQSYSVKSKAEICIALSTCSLMQARFNGCCVIFVLCKCCTDCRHMTFERRWRRMVHFSLICDLVWMLNIPHPLVYCSFNTITVIYLEDLGYATDSAVTNRLDLSLPQSSQKELTSQKEGSRKMTIPYTTIKEVFSFDDDDKRSEGWRLFQELDSTPSLEI